MSAVLSSFIVLVFMNPYNAFYNKYRAIYLLNNIGIYDHWTLSSVSYRDLVINNILIIPSFLSITLKLIEFQLLVITYKVLKYVRPKNLHDIWTFSSVCNQHF